MRSALIAILFLLTMAPAAGAASIAYVDGGEVWLSSLDGAQKVRLATHVVNSSGETEKWLAVAASDSGRIVAARNFPGQDLALLVVQGVGAERHVDRRGAAQRAQRLGHRTSIRSASTSPRTAVHMVYGYSNSSSCCPISFAQGTYVRPVTNSSLDPINVSGQEHPTLFGNRMIAHSGDDRERAGRSGPTYGTTFTPWIDVSGTGLELRRTDVAANGQLAALELEQWDGGGQTIGKIAVLATQGVDQAPTFPAAVDCFLPTTGVAKDVSLSLDATRIAWTDDGGLKVAGTPTTADGPVRAHLAAGRDLADRLAGRDRRGEHRGRSCPRPARAAGRRARR